MNTGRTSLADSIIYHGAVCGKIPFLPQLPVVPHRGRGLQQIAVARRHSQRNRNRRCAAQYLFHLLPSFPNPLAETLVHKKGVRIVFALSCSQVLAYPFHR